MNKTVPLADLVQLRKAKEGELKILQTRAKNVRKEIREINKVIQVNLNEMLTTGSKEEVPVDNFGYQVQDLMDLAK